MITEYCFREIDKNRQFMQESLRQQEVLNVAAMAVQTGQNHLKMNGIEVEIIKKDGEVYVYGGKQEILHVKKTSLKHSPS